MPQTDEDEDEVFTYAVSRQISPWLFAGIAASLAKDICHALEAAFDDVQTVFVHQFNWVQERKSMHEQAAREIETMTGGFDASTLDSSSG